MLKLPSPERDLASLVGRAIELEALASGAAAPAPLVLPIGDDGVLDPRPLLAELVECLVAGAPAPALALGFHHAVAGVAAASARRVREQRSYDGPVALSGGVFQNALLTRLTRSRLDDDGFVVLTHRLVPPNDGGLSLGQAVITGHAARRQGRH